MTVKVDKVEKKENSKVVMEVTLDAAEVSAAYTQAAKKAAAAINVPGFRKGKAPKNIVEKYAGKDALNDEVRDILFQPTLLKAYKEADMLPVSRPVVDVVQMEDGKDMIIKVTMEVKPEVELGQYTGLNLERPSSEITEEQVDKELERRQKMHATLAPVEDGVVETDDVVFIDFEGFVDGVPFEGGKGENMELTIGSAVLIPGFEDQLKGAKLGEEREINVRFPDDYQNQELAGKDSMFKVKINAHKRKELVALDDEFAKDVSEFDTLAELREDIKKNMASAAATRVNNEYRAEVVKKVVENATTEVPEGMLEERINYMLEEFKKNLSYQGVSMEQFYEYLNNNREQIWETYSKQATDGIKTELVLEAISKKENIEVTDEAINKELEKVAEEYKRSVEEIRAAIEANGEMDRFKISLEADLTIDFLVEKNTVEKKDTGE